MPSSKKKLYSHISGEDIKSCIQYAAKLCQVGEVAEPYEAGNVCEIAAAADVGYRMCLPTTTSDETT
jgi:hypothetical protein